MNQAILAPGPQEYIESHLDSDTFVLLGKNSEFEGIGQRELVEQIIAKKKCRGKLPSWHGTKDIYYPSKLNIEQASSEKTALYKSQIVTGASIIDMTGGFGVDSYYFSKRFKKVVHCERDPKLSAIAKHNLEVLGVKNVMCAPGDGIAFLKNNDSSFDWAFIDPSRRNDKKGKVFLLEDCEPNIIAHLPAIFQRAKNVLIKTSPLLDIEKGIAALGVAKGVHVIAVDNEVKELLWVLQNGHFGETNVRTINIKAGSDEIFDYKRSGERNATAQIGEPLSYLFEPNAAILKAGAFKTISEKFGLRKLHRHSHLYTADRLVDFPGRQFRIKKQIPFSKKNMKAFKGTSANITIRNFPISVAEIRKRFDIKAGGDRYLFFTTVNENKKMVLVCTKNLRDKAM